MSLLDQQAQACYLNPICGSARGKSVHRRVQKVWATLTGSYLKKRKGKKKKQKDEEEVRIWLHLVSELSAAAEWEKN